MNIVKKRVRCICTSL